MEAKISSFIKSWTGSLEKMSGITLSHTLTNAGVPKPVTCITKNSIRISIRGLNKILWDSRGGSNGMCEWLTTR